MSTAVMPDSRSLTALAKVEALRYARHPVFLVGALLCAVTVGLGVHNVKDDYYSPPMGAALFLGVFGIVVGFRLTQSLQRSAEAMTSAPATMQQRVGALLLASLVPGALGLIVAMVALTVPSVAGSWVYGTWSGADRLAIFLAMATIASIGGPLLGIATARWLRFPGAVVVPIVVVVMWSIVGNGWTANNQNAIGWLVVRLFSPFAFFTTLTTSGGPHRVESWRGDPGFFLLWLVFLCAATAIVALLKDADGPVRDTLRRTLVVVVVLALASFALAVVAGPDHATVRSPAGTSRL